jgi:aerobic-type carbon monoxide dehydrogenase small subunit (CoxS/CutS family)
MNITLIVNGETAHLEVQAMRLGVYSVSGVGKAEVTTLEGLGTQSIRTRCNRLFIDEQASSAAIAING